MFDLCHRCLDERYSDARYGYALRVEGTSTKMIGVHCDDDLISLPRMLGSSWQLTLYMKNDHKWFVVACEKHLLEEVENIADEEFESFDDTTTSMSMP